MKKLIGILAALSLLFSVASAEAASYGVIGGADGPTAIYASDDYYVGYQDGYQEGYSDGYADGSGEYYEDDFDVDLDFNEDDYFSDYYYDYDPECVWVMLNGSYVWFEEVDACEIDGSIFVPMREMFDAFGAKVMWNQSSQSAIGVLGDKTVEFFIGGTTYYVNGEAKTLPVAPQIKNGKTMLPIRALSEALGAKVIWNTETYEVEISYLRPLSDDEQYLYDIMTNKDMPISEQKGSMKLSAAYEDFDINFDMDIKSIGNNEFSYNKILLRGDLYRNLVKIDADIELWLSVNEDETEVSYMTLNGAESDTSVLDDLGMYMPNLEITNFGAMEQNALYSMFNSLEISSVSEKNNQKIISFSISSSGIALPFTYYIDTKTNLPTKLICDLTSYFDVMFGFEDIIFSAEPFEINIKYDNVKIPVIPKAAK